MQSKLAELSSIYNIQTIDLDPWFDQPFFKRKIWLSIQIMSVYKPVYAENERVVFTLSRGDIYASQEDPVGQLIKDFYRQLNTIDISNFFVILLTNDNRYIPLACQWAQRNISTDPVSITHIAYADQIHKRTIEKKMTTYSYNSVEPTKISLSALNDKHRYLLTESPSFCMYPWIHLHAYPTGQAYPCCHSEMKHPVGNCRTDTLEEIWNNTHMRDIRQRMLSDRSVDACVRCYEQEASGFFSGRLSANKHHGHLINQVDGTDPNGQVDQFRLTYWDIRFSNLCNLSCRSCGHIFSSSWYQDQAKLAGDDWKERNTVLNYAGRTSTDIWEQLIPHLDYVEQIYFAGGEPLMMEEHYNILDELERRGRFDVRLIYNTNFTHVRLKDRTVFDYWKKFKSVAVGASLDGTVWDAVERNREQMLQVCPEVDFYISPTLSIMNARHLPDFHRDWVDRGLIRPQDLNVNILQDPAHLRIDIAPADYKIKLFEKYQEHIAWLGPLDPLQRATVGFESAVKFMMATDNSKLIPKFWAKTTELDHIRKESVLDTIPELGEIK
jgi:organic radical activating enzyme